MRRVTRSSTRQAEAAEAAEAANDPPDLLQIAAALSVVVAQHAIIRGMLDSKGLAALRACGKLGKAAVDPNIRVLKAPARRVLPAAKSLSADWCHVRYLNLSDISHHTPDASVLRFFTQLRTMHCMAAMRASLKAVSVRVQSLDGALKVCDAAECQCNPCQRQHVWVRHLVRSLQKSVFYCFPCVCAGGQGTEVPERTDSHRPRLQQVCSGWQHPAPAVHADGAGFAICTRRLH